MDQTPVGLPDCLHQRGLAFTYLCAERLGPRDQLGVSADQLDEIEISHRGEYTAQVLALRETDEVSRLLQHPSTAEHGVTTLRTQVERWASDIVRPIRISAQWLPGLTASMVRFHEPGLLTEQIRPTNMGFGVSYALPIIVAGLLAPTGGLMIVENPEAHLHPAGQSRLGRFLGRLAGSGMQVILETHSDHVINGVRLACIEPEGISPHRVAIHYFSEQGNTTIDVTSTGGLSTWPSGFFDQIEDDLGRISRARRRNG